MRKKQRVYNIGDFAYCRIDNGYGEQCRIEEEINVNEYRYIVSSHDGSRIILRDCELSPVLKKEWNKNQMKIVKIATFVLALMFVFMLGMKATYLGKSYDQITGTNSINEAVKQKEKIEEIKERLKAQIKKGEELKKEAKEDLLWILELDSNGDI